MANSSQAVSLLAAALCIFSILGLASCHDQFFVEGKVYCDTCRVQFETTISEFLPGSKVKLECRERAGGQVTFSIEGECDSSGTYHLPVEGNHEEEICEVILLKSSNPECAEIVPDRNRARVVLTKDVGMATPVRQANTLGFMKKVPHRACPDVLRKIGVLPTGPV